MRTSLRQLYRLLASDEQHGEVLDSRLEQVGLSHSWLNEAADTYEAKWTADLTYATPGEIKSYALTPEHSILATWVLASLRNTGHSHDLSSDLTGQVLQRALSDLPELNLPLPPVSSPVILGWTLGSVVGIGGLDLPVVPAALPEDINARAAFAGLVEHVLRLQVMPDPWPEIMCTSTYWRGYGIAEGLRPEFESGGLALRQLLGESQRLVPYSIQTELNRHFSPFSARRNALSHVADSQGRPRFIDVVDLVRDWQQLRPTILGLTLFVCQEVSKEVLEERPVAVRPGVWENLIHEIRTDW